MAPRLGIGLGIGGPYRASAAGGASIDLDTTLSERFKAEPASMENAATSAPSNGDEVYKWTGSLYGIELTSLIVRYPTYNSAGYVTFDGSEGMRNTSGFSNFPQGGNHSIHYVIDPKAPATSNQSLTRHSHAYFYVETGAGGGNNGLGIYTFPDSTFYGVGDLSTGKQLISFELDGTTGEIELFVNNVSVGGRTAALPSYVDKSWSGTVSLCASSDLAGSHTNCDLYEWAFLSQASAIDANTRSGIRAALMTEHGL